MFKDSFMPALKLFIASSLVCGVVYTFAVTLLGGILFPNQASGSIIEVDGVVYGSELLGQQFSDAGHMWGRVTNVDVANYTDAEGNPVAYASPSNMSPATDAYEQVIAGRVEMMREANPDMDTQAIPVELVTASGSGLDPHISLAAAEYQIPRIAAENNMDEADVQDIIDACTTKPLFGLFGQAHVNVLQVNLMLEGIL